MRRYSVVPGLIALITTASILTAVPANAANAAPASGTRPAAARTITPDFSIGTCPASGFHVWGHQYASGNYYGQYGWFTTYNMSVPHYTSAFSLSHLYSYAGNANPASAGIETEVGYYKGLGNHSYNSPHYYWTYMTPSQGYNETDSTSGPAAGSSISYQVEFVTYNASLGTDDWQEFWNGVGTVRGTAHMKSTPNAHALAGGEVQGDGSSTTQMETHGTADQQIISTSYSWNNWTTSFTSTTACKSSGVTYKENSNYMDFTVGGSAG